jgi:hypothetical protein
LARELDVAVETIEVGSRNQIKSVLSGGSRDSLTTSLFESKGSQRSKFCIVLDVDRRAERLGRSGIHGRILQLQLRSSAQGQEKESDIANGSPLARGARTLRQGCSRQSVLCLQD